MARLRNSSRSAAIKHLWAWPNTPKMNARVERFNRAMWDNLHWYNTKRPHAGISLRTPLEVLAEWMPE